MGLKIVMPAEYQRVKEISLTAMPLGGSGVKCGSKKLITRA